MYFNYHKMPGLLWIQIIEFIGTREKRSSEFFEGLIDFLVGPITPLHDASCNFWLRHWIWVLLNWQKVQFADKAVSHCVRGRCQKTVCMYCKDFGDFTLNLVRFSYNSNLFACCGEFERVNQFPWTRQSVDVSLCVIVSCTCSRNPNLQTSKALPESQSQCIRVGLLSSAAANQMGYAKSRLVHR